MAEEKKIKHWGIQIAGSLQEEGIVESVTKNGILKSIVGFPRTLLITAASMQSDTAEIVQLAAVVARKQNNAASQERLTDFILALTPGVGGNMAP